MCVSFKASDVEQIRRPADEIFEDDLVFIREDLKEEQKIKDEEFKQMKGQLKENDIKIEEELRLLDGDFMQYRKLMEFFTEYQEEYMRQMQQLMTQKEVKVDEITRMMHTLNSKKKAIRCDSFCMRSQRNGR